MKHVFVETNFLVDLLRPRPSRDAVDLFRGNDGVNLRLYIPWCSQSESLRTLNERIIKEDLGFTDAMMACALRHWLANRAAFDRAEIEKLRDLADNERVQAFRTIEARIQTAVDRMTRIDPSPDVITRTLQVFKVKSLKPFDEMVLGAVLTKATELYDAGERDLVFCTLDGDLANKHPPLVSEYARCGLKVSQGFRP